MAGHIGLRQTAYASKAILACGASVLGETIARLLEGIPEHENVFQNFVVSKLNFKPSFPYLF